MKTDFREYTIREAGKSLTTLEIHLKQSKDDAVFCNECTQKHFLEVEKFGEEGAGFFPENKQWWEDLETWARESARALTLAKKDQGRFASLALKVYGQARQYRKKIVVMLEEEIERQENPLAESPFRDTGRTCPVCTGFIYESPEGLVCDCPGGPDEEMSEEEAHRYILELSGLEEADLAGEKAYLVGHAGLGCLLGGCDGELGALFQDKESEARAKKEGCTCMILDEDTGSQICWAKGGIGALNKAQQAQYCTAKNTVTKKAKKTSGIGKVIAKFREANQQCRANANASFGKNTPDRTVKVFAHYTGCMTNSLTKGGKLPKPIEPRDESKPSETPVVAPAEQRGTRQVSVKL